MTHMSRSLGAFLMVGLGLVLAAGPAAAHAEFASSDPPEGATTSEPVETITLFFTGDAEPTGSGFVVLEPNGERRLPDDAFTTDGSTWVLSFDPALSGGVVGVRWMVKAPDAHPIEGSFSFTTTAPALSALRPPADAGNGGASGATGSLSEGGSVAAQDLEGFLDTGDPTASARALGAAARIVILVGTLVGVGAFVFAAAALRGNKDDFTHVLHWVRRAGIVVVVGAVVELFAHVLVEGGGEWSALVSASSIESVLGSSSGAAFALRVAGGLALTAGARLQVGSAEGVPDPVVAIRELVGIGAGPSGRAIPPRPAAARHARLRVGTGNEPWVHTGDQAWAPSFYSSGAIGGAAALVASHAFDGHTVSKGDRLLTSIAAMVHVAGGAVWVGGVLMLVAVVWRRHRQRRDPRVLQLAVRFSVIATIAIVAVGAAGVGLTAIVLDSPSELWATEWGRTLIAKSVFVGVAGCVGAYNHMLLIPEMSFAPHDPAITHRFRRVVTVEAAALLGVLVVTALLMGAAS